MLARSQQEVSCRNENWRGVDDKSPSSSVKRGRQVRGASLPSAQTLPAILRET
jgi:hypothetical protein